MSLFLIGTLVVLGLVLVVLEILVFPGTTLVGILGFASLSYAVYECFQTYGTMYGYISLAVVVLLLLFLLFWSLRSKTWKKLSLEAAVEGKANLNSAHLLEVGKIGETVSRLAPMGTANFDGIFCEVQSQLDFIDPHQKVEIVQIENNKIWVRLYSKNDPQ